MDIISVLAIIASAGFILTIFSFFQELGKRRKKKEEPTLQDKISDYTKNLEFSSTLVAEIQAEISKKKNELEQLQADIERTAPLKEINQAQAEAVARVLEIPIKKGSRKSSILNLIGNFVIALGFFTIGYFFGGR